MTPHPAKLARLAEHRAALMLAERWRQVAAAESSLTKCATCGDGLTADELRQGWTRCLWHQPSPAGVETSPQSGGAAPTGGAADGPVAGSTPISPSVSPAAGPRTERTTE